MLKNLVKYNTEAYESAVKAGKELMGLLDYLPVSVWLEVADTMTQPLVFVQVLEVVEIINEAQAQVDKTKPMEGEVPVEDIIVEQNLPNMSNLKHAWGYNTDEIKKKTVAAIIYKYLKEAMFKKTHVLTIFLSRQFAMVSSMLHKYIVGKKYKGGVAPGSLYKSSTLEYCSRKQQEDPEVNRGASGSGLTAAKLPKSKGAGKKMGKKRDATEIWGNLSKPSKRKRDTQDDDDEDDNNRSKPHRAPVTRKGIIIAN